MHAIANSPQMLELPGFEVAVAMCFEAKEMDLFIQAQCRGLNQLMLNTTYHVTIRLHAAMKIKRSSTVGKLNAESTTRG